MNAKVFGLFLLFAAAAILFATPLCLSESADADNNYNIMICTGDPDQEPYEVYHDAITKNAAAMVNGFDTLNIDGRSVSTDVFIGSVGQNLTSYDLLIVLLPTQMDSTSVARIQAYVQSGGYVVFIGGNQTHYQTSNSIITSVGSSLGFLFNITADSLISPFTLDYSSELINNISGKSVYALSPSSPSSIAASSAAIGFAFGTSLSMDLTWASKFQSGDNTGIVFTDFNWITPINNTIDSEALKLFENILRESISHKSNSEYAYSPIILNTVGGTIQDPLSSMIYREGSSLNLPSDVRLTDYGFTGWFDNEECTGEPKISITSSDRGDVILWAGWTDDCEAEVTLSNATVIQVAYLQNAVKLFNDNPNSTISLLKDVTISNEMSLTSSGTIYLNNHIIDAKGRCRIMHISSDSSISLHNGTTDTLAHHYRRVGELYTFDTVYRPYHIGTCQYGILANGKNMNSTDPYSGAIYNEGSLNIVNVSFIGNRSYTGSAIYSAQSSSLFVEYSKFDYNTASSGTYSGEENGCGGAITLNNTSSLFLSNCVISNSTSANYGGAVYMIGTNNLSIYECTISNNTGAYGGGIASLYEGSEITVSGNGVYTGNSASNMGGFCMINGNITIYGGTFSNNTVDDTSSFSMGGCIYSSKQLIIEGGLFSSNSAKFGGSIYSSGTLSINGSDIAITSNSAQYGGGIYILNDMTFANGIISYNTASHSGGGIYTNTGKLIMTGGYILYNSAEEWGGGLICYSEAVISGGSFTFNQASKGSAVAVDAGSMKFIAGSIHDNVFTQDGDKWSVYIRNNGTVSAVTGFAISDGINIESGNIYLSGSPSIANTVATNAAPLYLSGQDAIFHASSADTPDYFTGSVEFSCYSDKMVDGAVLVHDVYEYGNHFSVFQKPNEYYLAYDSVGLTLAYTKYEVKNGVTYYPTLDDALLNYDQDLTVELLKDTTITITFEMASFGKDRLVIYGNDHTISDNAVDDTFRVNGNGTLELMNVTFALVSSSKPNLINLLEGTASLREVTIQDYTADRIINVSGTGVQLNLSSVDISYNNVMNEAIYISGTGSNLNICGNCLIKGNTDGMNEKDIVLTGSEQLNMTGDTTGEIGVSYNNGLNLQFGVASGNYTGADSFFSTVSPYIIGSINDSNLFWCGKEYQITYYLYNTVTDFGTYIYGTAFILPTTYQRKGFQFSKWLNSSGEEVTVISAGESGPKEYYAQWTQSEIFVSASGSDVTGEGTMDNPFLTITKAYSVATDGNTVAILTDITIDATIEFNRDIKLILCSENGIHSLIRGNSLTNYLLQLDAGSTILTDIILDGNGLKEGRNVDHALIYVQQSGSLTLEDGTELFNNIITETGASTDKNSGAIQLNDLASLYIRSGASIHNNIAFSGSAIHSKGYSYIEMSGGSITDNFNYTDCEGGAIFISSSLKMTVTGLITIKDNYRYISPIDTSPSNVYLENNAFIQIGKAGLNIESEIHVSTYTTSSDTDVLIVKEANLSLSVCFIPDDTTRNLLFCNGTENEYGLYHHYPCVPNSFFLTTEIIHEHVFSQTFTWNSDYSSATITLVCQHDVCKKTVTDESTVTHDQKSVPTCTDSGLIVHTASYVYDEQTYIENVNEVLEALGHISYHGYCSREGCGIELFDADYIARIDGHYKYVTLEEALGDIAEGHQLNLIADVTMMQSLVVSKSFILNSYTGAYTIKRGYDGYELFTITNNSTVVINDIIFDGNGTEFPIDNSCGIISIMSGSTVTIMPNVVVKNTVTIGDTNHGAIFVDGGTLNLYGGTFRDNFSVEKGAAIFGTNNSKIYLKGNVMISDNYIYSTETISATRTPSNVSYTSDGEFCFDCNNFTGTLSLDFNNEINGVFGTYISGSGYDRILNDVDIYFHAKVKDDKLLWVVDYNVDLYLGSEDVFKTPYYTLVTTYMSTYGYLPDGVLEGHTFIGWYTALNGGFRVYSDTVVDFQSSHHLYAHWTVNEYKLTVDRNNGEPVTETMVPYGTILEIETPVKIGHSFVTWSPEIPQTMPSSEVSVTAQWSINTYTIRFDSKGGSNVMPISQLYGTVITAPADPELKGYSFDGWDQPLPATMPAEDRTYSAVWSINKYTIIFDTDGGSFIAPMTVEFNGTIYLPDPPTKPGYTFNNWDGSIYSKMPDHDIYLKARWNVNYYKIAFDTDGGSAVNPIWQPCDSAVKKPANPTKQGYTFLSWSQEIPDYVPPYDTYITAIWIPRTDTHYTVQHLVQNSDASYTLNLTENLTGTTDTQATVTLMTYDHHIAGRYDPTQISAKGNTVIKVYYDIEHMTVTFDSNGGSAVASQEVLYGAKATVPDEPTKKGYTFNYWMLNGIEFNFNTPIYKNIDLDAKWTGCTVTVLVDYNGLPVAADVSVMNGSGTFVSGRTDSDGSITFSDVPFGSFNIKATSTDGKYYTTVGAIFSGTVSSVTVDLPVDKVNTDVDANINNNVSVSNIINAISDSERQSVVKDGSIESLSIIMKVSEIDTLTSIQKLGGKAGIVESYDIEVYKLTKFTDSSTFRKILTETDQHQILTFEISDKMLKAMSEGGFSCSNIVIYHTHENSLGHTVVSAIKKQASYEEVTKDSGNCFCIVTIEGQQYIMLKTDEYSVYSFGLAEEDKNNGGTDNTLIYILIGAAVAVTLILVIGYLCLRKRKSKAQ